MGSAAFLTPCPVLLSTHHLNKSPSTQAHSSLCLCPTCSYFISQGKSCWPCPRSRTPWRTMLQQHAAKVQKYNAATAGETVGSVIPSTTIALSKVIEQPVKAGHWSPRLQVCLPDSYNSSRKTGSRKAVILNLTNRSLCNYLHTFFSQLWPISRPTSAIP